MSSTGNYFNSKFENSKVRSFSHTDKNFELGGIYHNCKEAGNHLYIKIIRFNINLLEKVPGPGSYRLNSDFGQYESKKII
jgi:hypothetical protein